MKFLMSVVVAALVVGSLAMAADSEKSANDTVDTSKNPITGTVKTTKKMKRKVKQKDGKSAEVNMTDTTKTKKNGETTEDVKADADSKPSN